MKKNRKLFVTLFLLLVVIAVEAKKTSRSRSSGSGRGSSRKTSNPQPVPTSFSNPQPTAAKPSLFGWQEKPAQRTQTYPSRQSQPSGNQGHSYPSSNTGHSYPSSNTGLSGNSPPKQPPNNQESIQRSNSYNSHVQQTASGTAPQPHNQPINNNNPPSHPYPASNGLSGNTGSGAGYPSQQGKGLSGSGVGYPSQGGGLSGSGAAPPPYPGVKPGDVNRPYNGGNYPQQHPINYHGNNNNHQQGPPNYGSSNGGFGGHGHYNPGYGSQMPGYFGNYGNNGGIGRTGSSTLSKVGLAGAGIGTVLTGLALWNMARSTGHHHHTVIYDNRGQPVAVAPTNDTEVVDPFLTDLVNCTLTISNVNATEVLAIPCAIATSFRPDADIKDSRSTTDSNDNTKCTITIVTKSEREYMTTIPCSILLSTAAENNVTEPPLLSNGTDVFNETMTNSSDVINTNQPSALMLAGTNTESTNPLLNCTLQPPDIQDPINPCLPVTHNLTVIPLQFSQNGSTLFTPGSA